MNGFHMTLTSILNLILALTLAPLLPGIVNRTKAVFAGRHGQPLLQLYYDLFKLFRKGAVYSRTTTWVFRAGPLIGFAAVVTALLFIPLGGIPGLMAFPGDLIVFAYLFGLMRFFTVAAALDTGSSFEGMGSSREVMFSTIAEPALLLGLVALACETKSLSLSAMYSAVSPDTWQTCGPALAMVTAALFIVFLSENSRIPVDDPNTHLELTMIHEVMVLDHGGPDLGFILYGSAIKFWALGSLITGIVIPVRTSLPLLNSAAALVGLFILAVAVGVVESIMARLRLKRVPQLLVAASAFSILALVLILR